MKNFKLILIITFNLLILQVVNGASNSPFKVLNKYLNYLHILKDYKAAYKLISSKSKDNISEQEFINFYSSFDKKNNTSKTKYSYKIFEIDTGKSNVKYKRYEIKDTTMNKDTIYDLFYKTLINEDGDWKIIWTRSLNDAAYDKYCKGDIENAIKQYENIIEIDPFSGDAYRQLAWCYIEPDVKDKKEIQNKISNYIQYAMSIEPDESRNYNCLAEYNRRGLNNNTLAIEYYKKALSLALDKNTKSTYCANLCLAYQNTNDIDSATNYIEKAIKLEPESSFNWKECGFVYHYKNDSIEAKKAFEKSLKYSSGQPNEILKDIYYGYALSCISLSEFNTAEEYILKALAIAPDNEVYKKVFDYIKGKK